MENKKQKNIKISNKDWKSKYGINKENYLMKKKIKKESIGKIDTDICLKKINKNWKNIKKLPQSNENIIVKK